MNPVVIQHQRQIYQLCQRYGVERLDLFGSATGEHFDPATSDFDFIVRFFDADKAGISQRFFGLAEELEAILQRPVDLLTDKTFTNPYFAQTVAQTRQVIYDQRSKETLV
jgi:predicted nucleotidyltransferase